MRVLWHTPWWTDAAERIGPVLGLTHLSNPATSMFATWPEFTGDPTVHRPQTATEPPCRPPWKLNAIERWLAEHPATVSADPHTGTTTTHELLIWIDAHLHGDIDVGFLSHQLLNDPRLILISPDAHTGINAAQLTQLRALTALPALTPPTPRQAHP